MWHLIIESHLCNPELPSAEGDEAASTQPFLDVDPVLPDWPPDGDPVEVFDTVKRAEGRWTQHENTGNKRQRRPSGSGCGQNVLEQS